MKDHFAVFGAPQGRVAGMGGLRRLAALVLLACSSAAPAFAQAPLAPVVREPQVDKPRRVLFIGNSLLYYSGALQSHTHRLGSADNPPLDLDPGYRTVNITGATLDEYPLEFFLAPGILGVKEPFQLVVLAGNSLDATSEERAQAYRKKAIEFDGVVKKHGAKTALYWLPALVKPHKLADVDIYHADEKLFISTANEIGALLIPVGAAYAKAYRQRPGIKLQVYDGNHPSVAGQYLSAAVTYGALYGRPTIGNPYDYFGALDAVTRGFLQKVADDTVKKFYGR